MLKSTAMTEVTTKCTNHNCKLSSLIWPPTDKCPHAVQFASIFGTSSCRNELTVNYCVVSAHATTSCVGFTNPAMTNQYSVLQRSIKVYSIVFGILHWRSRVFIAAVLCLVQDGIQSRGCSPAVGQRL